MPLSAVVVISIHKSILHLKPVRIPLDIPAQWAEPKKSRKVQAFMSYDPWQISAVRPLFNLKWQH